MTNLTDALIDKEVEDAFIALVDCLDELGCFPAATVANREDEGISFSLHFSAPRARQLIAARPTITKQPCASDVERVLLAEVVAELEGLSKAGVELDELDISADLYGRIKQHLISSPIVGERPSPTEEGWQAEALDAFLDLIADAHDWHDEPDGDETGDHTTYHLITHWRQMERLCLALGIKEPRYMETWMNAIDRALDREPLPKAPEETR